MNNTSHTDMEGLPSRLSHIKKVTIGLVIGFFILASMRGAWVLWSGIQDAAPTPVQAPDPIVVKEFCLNGHEYYYTRSGGIAPRLDDFGGPWPCEND